MLWVNCDDYRNSAGPPFSISSCEDQDKLGGAANFGSPCFFFEIFPGLKIPRPGSQLLAILIFTRSLGEFASHPPLYRKGRGRVVPPFGDDSELRSECRSRTPDPVSALHVNYLLFSTLTDSRSA